MQENKWAGPAMRENDGLDQPRERIMGTSHVRERRGLGVYDDMILG
jgi:hypothetical protein